MSDVVQAAPNIPPPVAFAPTESVGAGSHRSLECESIFVAPDEVILHLVVTNEAQRRAWLHRFAGRGRVKFACCNRQIDAVEALVVLRPPVMDSPTFGKVCLGVVHVKAVACLELHLLSYLQRLPFAAWCAVLQRATQHLVSGVEREYLHRFNDCVFAKIKFDILDIFFRRTLQEDGLALRVST